MKRSTTFSLVLAGALLLLLVAIGAALAALPPGGTFNDDNGNIHEGNIEAIAARGITKGCNPPTNDLYCPRSSVTRGQMAAFLVRALGLTDRLDDPFIDDDDSVFEADIEKLAAAGITKGCNPPDNTKFCPNSEVTREVMAAFLVRAFGYTDNGGGDLFTDDDGSIFEADIDRLGTAGVTKGCNPPSNTLYCPKSLVLRDQMASFLSRALGLPPIVPPPPTTTTTTTTPPPTTGSISMSYSSSFLGDSWSGTAGSDSVTLRFSSSFLGDSWSGTAGSDSVTLRFSSSFLGDSWSGNIGSDSVTLRFSSSFLGDSWSGNIGSDSVTLRFSSSFLGDSWSGNIGSDSVTLRFSSSFLGDSWSGTGPRSAAAIVPILDGRS